MDSGPRRPSLPEGNRGTGGPGRAGTASAEVQLLGWTEGEAEQRGGEQGVTEGDGRGEEGEPGTRAELEGEGFPFGSG